MTTRTGERPVTEQPAGRLCQVLARYGAALLLAGYLLFAHGCHGDEDNELFGACRHRAVINEVSGVRGQFGVLGADS
jgi:hypothetical protein